MSSIADALRAFAHAEVEAVSKLAQEISGHARGMFSEQAAMERTEPIEQDADSHDESERGTVLSDAEDTRSLGVEGLGDDLLNDLEKSEPDSDVLHSILKETDSGSSAFHSILKE
jgi:hypothetical protein